MTCKWREIHDKKNELVGIMAVGHAGNDTCCTAISTCFDVLKVGLQDFKHHTTKVVIEEDAEKAMQRIEVFPSGKEPVCMSFALTFMLGAVASTLDEEQKLFPHNLIKQKTEYRKETATHGKN